MSSQEFTRNGVRYKSLAYRDMPNYWVGDDGSYWSVKDDDWTRLKGGLDWGGYRVVNVMTRKGWRVQKLHRLILETFVGPCPEGMECRHLNGNRDDNRLENIRWGTKKGNQKDRVRHGTDPSGERNGEVKVTEAQVLEIREKYATGNYSCGALGKEYGLSKAQAYRIVTGVSWKNTGGCKGIIGNSGERVYCAKLNENAVRAIRSSNESNADLARQYGASSGAIRNIRIGKTWKDVK